MLRHGLVKRKAPGYLLPGAYAYYTPTVLFNYLSNPEVPLVEADEAGGVNSPGLCVTITRILPLFALPSVGGRCAMMATRGTPSLSRLPATVLTLAAFNIQADFSLPLMPFDHAIVDSDEYLRGACLCGVAAFAPLVAVDVDAVLSGVPFPLALFEGVAAVLRDLA
jgi:hypothetical protein